MKKITTALIVLAAIGIIGYFGFNAYIDSANSPIDQADTEDIRVEIPSGSTTPDISSILLDNGLIDSEFAFEYRAKASGMASDFKAGVYYFNRSMGAESMMEEITEGGEDVGVRVFTIPEGYEVEDIADQLSEEGIVERDKFLDAASNIEDFKADYPFLENIPEDKGLEGYLYPDTYKVNENTDNLEVVIIDMMLGNFYSKYTDDLKERQENLGLTLNQTITLASIIEREAQVEEERTTISAVFHNRIDDGMRLQSCATVQYILGERKPNLSYEDVRIESPYNTYMNQGLPPTPIASPGIESIKAALNPEDVDYLYFVAKGDGSHIFSETYEDHIEAQNNM